jgi:cullin-4
LEQNQISDLRRLYTLCKRLNQLEHLRLKFGEYIKSVGMKIVSNKERGQAIIEDLLAFKHQVDKVHDESFEHHGQFGYMIVESFEAFMNSRNSRTAELLGKYIQV